MQCAPDNIGKDDNGYYIKRQSETKEEVKNLQDAAAVCPVDVIIDGEKAPGEEKSAE